MKIVQNAKNICVVGVTPYARHINGNTGMSNKMQMISWSQPVLRQQFEYGKGSADIHKYYTRTLSLCPSAPNWGRGAGIVIAKKISFYDVVPILILPLTAVADLNACLPRLTILVVCFLDLSFLVIMVFFLEDEGLKGKGFWQGGINWGYTATT